jgi:hypothetical protein
VLARSRKRRRNSISWEAVLLKMLSSKIRQAHKCLIFMRGAKVEVQRTVCTSNLTGESIGMSSSSSKPVVETTIKSFQHMNEGGAQGLTEEADKAWIDCIIIAGVRSFVFQNIPIGRDNTVGRKNARRSGCLGKMDTVPATSSPLGMKRGSVAWRH